MNDPRDDRPPGREDHARTTMPAYSPQRATCQAICRAPCRVASRPSAAPTSDCAAIANESSSSAMNSHSCRPIWCAAICAVPIRAATAAADRNATWKAADAHDQVAADDQLRAHDRPLGTQPRRAPWRSARRNSAAPTACATTLAIADPSSPSPAG